MKTMYVNPYNNLQGCTGNWIKANFHTHAGTGPDTCGEYEVDDVVSLYKEAGYGILTISNHDSFLDTGEYGSKYGMAMINGFEFSDDPHMLCINVQNVIEGSHQRVIDECMRQGGFTILCHPNWTVREYWPWRKIDALRGYTGIEIYNGIIFRLEGSGLATDTWDHLLSQGKLVWGFASDDFHRWYDLARAWNVIYTPSENRRDIINSILNGSFYASTGLILNEMDVHDDTVGISVCAGDTYVKKYKYIFIGKDGHVLDEQNGEHGEYSLTGNEPYVRIQAISEHGAMLWTQPVYRADLFKKP